MCFIMRFSEKSVIVFLPPHDSVSSLSPLPDLFWIFIPTLTLLCSAISLNKVSGCREVAEGYRGTRKKPTRGLLWLFPQSRSLEAPEKSLDP